MGCLPPTQFSNGVYHNEGNVVRWYPEDFPLEILVDQDIDPKRTAPLQEAVLWWNEEVGASVFTITREVSFFSREVSNPSQATIFVADADIPDFTPGRTTQGYARLFWNGHRMKNVYILIDYAVPNSQAKSVFAHELGHALGLAHDESNVSLMYRSSVNSQERIQDDDIAFVRWEMQRGNSNDSSIPR